MSASVQLGDVLDRMAAILGQLDPEALTPANVGRVRRIAALSDRLFDRAVTAGVIAAQDGAGTTIPMSADVQAAPGVAALSEPQGV